MSPVRNNTAEDRTVPVTQVATVPGDRENVPHSSECYVSKSMYRLWKTMETGILLPED